MKNSLKNKQTGGILAIVLSSIVVLGVIAFVASTMYTGLIGGMQKTTLVSSSSTTLLQAAYTLTNETTRNASGIPVATAYLSSTPSPSGGGQIPASSAAPKVDSFGNVIGYCTSNSATLQSDPVFAIISSGSNKVFDTTCSQALSGIAIGDDKVIMKTVANIMQGVGGTIFYGDPVTISANLGTLSPVHVGEMRVALADSSVWINPTGTSGIANWVQVGGISGISSPFIHIQDQKAAGTNGGIASAGILNQTRVLNTVLANTIIGASLNTSTNIITLPAGKYRIETKVPSYNTTNNKAFLYNVTDTAYTLNGLNAYGSSAQEYAFIYGEFTISSSKDFTIRHYINTVQGLSTDFGVATNISGVLEVYSDVIIWKLN